MRSRPVFIYGQCGGPLVHGTNLSDEGQKSASGKWSHDGRESATKKVEIVKKSVPEVILSAGESFDRVTAR
jgi:hypothetical protein